ASTVGSPATATTPSMSFPGPAPGTARTPVSCSATFFASASSGPITAIVFIFPPFPRTLPGISPIALGPGWCTPRRNSRKTLQSAGMMTMTRSTKHPHVIELQAVTEESSASDREVTGGTGRRPLQPQPNVDRDDPRLTSFASGPGTLTDNQKAIWQ